jgi:hypothetical protein
MLLFTNEFKFIQFKYLQIERLLTPQRKYKNKSEM